MPMCKYSSGGKVLLCAHKPKQVINNSNPFPVFNVCEPSETDHGK